MFGNLSIRSKLLALLAVPVAVAVLLGLAGVMGETRTGRISLGAAIVALALAAGWAGSALAA